MFDSLHCCNLLSEVKDFVWKVSVKDEWIRGMLGCNKCRGADCYSMLISVNLLAAQTRVTWCYHVVFPHKITNESIS